MKVERSIDIAASPEEVYRLVMDPKRLEDWVTIHHGLGEAPDGELGTGSRLTQCLKLAGRRFNVNWTIVEDECPKRVVWDGKGPFRTRAKVIYEFSPEDGGGTSFSYLNEYDLPGGPAGKLAGRAVGRTAHRESEKSLERLKKLLEG